MGDCRSRSLHVKVDNSSSCVYDCGLLDTYSPLQLVSQLPSAKYKIQDGDSGTSTRGYHHTFHQTIPNVCGLEFSFIYEKLLASCSPFSRLTITAVLSSFTLEDTNMWYSCPPIPLRSIQTGLREG